MVGKGIFGVVVGQHTAGTEFADDRWQFAGKCVDMANHPNWFDASFISWLSYDSLNIELPDGHLYFAPIVNWGKYREENGRLVMPVTVRLNHAIADGYLVANVFRLLEQEIKAFVEG